MPNAQDLANAVLDNLREPGVNYGGLPTLNVGATFGFARILAALNAAGRSFCSKTGFAPIVNDVYSVLPIVAGQDFPVPANCKALLRVEYAQGGGGYFQPLRPCSFDEFDDQTGFQAAGSVQPQYDEITYNEANYNTPVLTNVSTGAPYVYREVFAGAIRLYPVPTADNVAAGDQIALYFNAAPNTLVLGTDVPSIPDQYHDALVAFALARFWLVKNDPGNAQAWMETFKEYVDEAKRLYFNANRGQTFGFVDDDLTLDSQYGDSDFVN